MSLTKEFFVILLTTDSSLVKQPFTNRISGVEFKRLDDLEIRKNKLFNVDTEGAGTEVLMGAEKILKNIASISADLESGSKDWSKNTIPEAINYVLSKNFELVVAIALSNSGTFLFKNMVSHKNWLLFGNFIFWAKYIL